MKKFEFSKLLIVFETALVAMLTLSSTYFSYLAIINNYSGALPYLTAQTTAAWAAYAVSAGFYYSKAKAENQIKIPAALEAANKVKRDL